MSNLPDDWDQRAFDAAFGSPLHESLSADTHTAAAMVYLASASGMDWTEASDWLDDCLAGDEPARASDTWTEQARDELAGLYRGNIKACAEIVVGNAVFENAKRERDAAKRAALRFIASLQVAA
jgi:hypothetical protein